MFMTEHVLLDTSWPVTCDLLFQVSMPHQWLEGNLPVSAKCHVCDKTCGSVLRLQDWRCLWCKAMVRCINIDTASVNFCFILMAAKVKMKWRGDSSLLRGAKSSSKWSWEILDMSTFRWVDWQVALVVFFRCTQAVKTCCPPSVLLVSVKFLSSLPRHSTASILMVRFYFLTFLRAFKKLGLTEASLCRILEGVMSSILHQPSAGVCQF